MATKRSTVGLYIYILELGVITPFITHIGVVTLWSYIMLNIYIYTLGNTRFSVEIPGCENETMFTSIGLDSLEV